MNKLITRLMVRSAAKIIFLLTLITTISLADSPIFPEQFGYGREPDAGEIEQWDIDIMPNGKQLPIGQGTTNEGEKIYIQKCLNCHGTEGINGIHDQLVGHGNGNPWRVCRTRLCAVLCLLGNDAHSDVLVDWSMGWIEPCLCRN